ncbi:SDR family oxidoreductase [Achromobacter sp. GG226]|uniref:SDR family NAD(P)-dependent oxidoreductase n=1 Tax=Verticiella alkaliphila TaxID=2779529 RepID=UPI001C0D57EC|nr:SDR family oxidoreductase [Verticiella sp. GG226]
MLLENRIVIVTGAARGNGEAIAHGVAREGAVAVVTDRDGDGAEAVAQAIREAGGCAQAHALDVTDAAACARVAEQVRAAVGPVDVLVNNAGIRPRHVFDSADRDDWWRRAMAVNVDGIRHMTLACLPSLKLTRGSIINLSSIAANQASAQSIAYSTSKAAAQMLTKVSALELAPHGIRVNAIAPGVIETAMTQSSRDDPERSERLLARIPLARFGRPEDVVGPVVFLASPMAAYVTGAVLAVDGGYLAV